MSRASRPPSSLSRRDLGRGALAGGSLLAFGFGSARAIGQGRRDLRVGVFGSDFGNLSPVIRWDAQSGLVMYNVFDQLTEVDYATRAIVPFVAEAWSAPDPLTWRIK